MTFALRNAVIGLVMAALIATGCAAVRSQALLSTLPTSAAGVEFDDARVIEESHLLWGHPVDDVLTVLGKSRSDATIVERYSRIGEGDIGALSVPGIEGDVLLDTFVATWRAPAVVARTQMTTEDHDAWALETRLGYFTLVYQNETTVYWASASDRVLAEQFVAAMR